MQIKLTVKTEKKMIKRIYKPLLDSRKGKHLVQGLGSVSIVSGSRLGEVMVSKVANSWLSASGETLILLSLQYTLHNK